MVYCPYYRCKSRNNSTIYHAYDVDVRNSFSALSLLGEDSVFLLHSPHINATANRASISLGFLKQNLKHCPSLLKGTAYIAIVRSVLEYACPIWDPHFCKDVDRLERVQRRAATFVNSDYRSTSSITSMLQSLSWTILEDQRRDVRLALAFKTVHGQVAVAVDDIHLTQADSRTRANHPYEYRQKPANTTELQNFFYPPHYCEVELSWGRHSYCLQPWPFLGTPPQGQQRWLSLHSAPLTSNNTPVAGL